MYRATLRLGEVTELCVRGGVIDPSVSIDDASVRDGTAVIEDWRALLDGLPVTEFAATLTSGATIVVKCASARLEFDERVRFLEEWRGPL